VVVGAETFSVENPNSLAVSVTVVNESGTLGAVTVFPGENVTVVGLAPGNYTLNATSEDGRLVPLNGNETLSVELVGTVDSGGAGTVPPPTPTTTTSAPTPTTTAPRTSTTTFTPLFP